jgi:UDP-N-acetylmuramoyl-tripeptide--D-alanyl-D-alanine ligase
MVGARAAEIVGWLIAIGPRARMIASAARQAGLAERKILCLDDPLEVINILHDRLQRGDVVLIKGSHGMRMDRIVSALEVAG